MTDDERQEDPEEDAGMSPEQYERYRERVAGVGSAAAGAGAEERRGKQKEVPVTGESTEVPSTSVGSVPVPSAGDASSKADKRPPDTSDDPEDALAAALDHAGLGPPFIAMPAGAGPDAQQGVRLIRQALALTGDALALLKDAREAEDAPLSAAVGGPGPNRGDQGQTQCSV